MHTKHKKYLISALSGKMMARHLDRVHRIPRERPCRRGSGDWSLNRNTERMKLLSRREKEVVFLLMQGKSNKQISLRLVYQNARSNFI